MSAQAQPSPQYSVRFAEAADAAAIRRFNQRMAAGAAAYRMSLEGRLPGEISAPEGYFLHRRQLLVLDGSEVRGGVLMQHHRISIRGQEQPFCWLQLPVSEGLVDRAYAGALIPLLKNALRHQRFALGLGVGSLEETWSRILIKTRWRYQSVPFFFYPANLRRVALELRYLNSRKKLKLAARVAASTGVASLAGMAHSAFGRLRHARSASAFVLSPAFDGWADVVYDRAASEYGALSNRRAASLNTLYAPEDQRYIRLRVQSKASGEELGWALVVHKQMRADKYFGNLHVGTLVNGCCKLRDTEAVLCAGLRHLLDLGCDLIVCNWSHGVWQRATRSLGFFSGPSNFILFASPHASPILEPACPLTECHMTRGDCDAPSSLM